jgi:hypothetical protein
MATTRTSHRSQVRQAEKIPLFLAFNRSHSRCCEGDQIAAAVKEKKGALDELIRRTPGDHLSFFSSFDCLDQVAAALRRECPGIPI